MSIHLTEQSAASDSAVIYFEYDDLYKEVERLKAKGFAFEQDPMGQSWNWHEAHLRDPFGNRICLYKAGENRRYPPWRVA